MYRSTLLDYMKVSLEYPALQFPKIEKKIVMMSRFNNSRGCNLCYDPRSIGHFTVVYLVAKPLIWSEAEGDLVVLETWI